MTSIRDVTIATVHTDSDKIEEESTTGVGCKKPTRKNPSRGKNTLTWHAAHSGSGAHLRAAVLEEEAVLLLVHVERHAAHLAALEAPDERRGVDELAAAGVDDHDALAHARDRAVVDHVVRAVQQRAVERDDLALLDELVQRDVLHAEAHQVRVLQPQRAH